MSESRRDTIATDRARSKDDRRDTRDDARLSRLGRRAQLWTFGLALGAVIGVVASRSFAEGKVPFLAEQLRKNPDFRVRTSAALSLGTTDDNDAIKPLCACLDDGAEVESVRVACAAALGKLTKPGSEQCLKSHTSDSSAKVKEQVGASLKALGSMTSSASSLPACPATATTAKAKYYVGINVLNKSSRPDAEVRPLVTREVRCKLTSVGRFRVAPDDAIDAKSMSAAMAHDKLEGWYVTVQIEPIAYDGGNLKVSMKLTLMTHARELKGEISKTLQLPGVGKPSKSDEDELLKLGAQKLADAFADLKP